MLTSSPRRAVGSGLSLIALLLAPAVASASPVTLFTDRDAFLAAANFNTLFTFDDPTATVCGVEGSSPFVFFVCRADFGGVEAAYFNPDPVGSTFPPATIDDVVPVIPTGVTFELPANTYAVGVDVLQAGLATFNIRFADGVEWTNVFVPPGCSFISPSCETFSGFVGVVSTDQSVPIGSFSARATPPGARLIEPPEAHFAPAVIDNLVMQVPEPATALLLCAGLVGVCWRRRRARHGQQRGCAP